ncbi:MAG TPA: hypothetical protein VMM12_18810 [Longimicrobiales bacterium]|nr:hypothetical protein [Longimicrobiales bacterium]
MSDDLDRFIDRAAPEYNRPPEPPREEMWAVIRERLPRGERRESAGVALDLEAARGSRERRRHLRQWTPWAVGIATAATLAAGFGLGRITREREPAARPPVTTNAPPSEGVPSRSVRLAAADHLGEAEALLTFYRNASREGDRAATARWAQDLLSTTRMMMDARAGDDPALAMLLGDLELVLVQIAAAGSEGGDEQELIEESMEQRQLLSKLRTASSGPSKTAM